MNSVPTLSDAAVKESVQLVRDFAGKFSDLTSSLIGILTANTQEFAAGNLYRLKDKLDKKNSDRKLKGLEPIPLRLAIPMLSRVSLESDDGMLDMWANLIHNFQNTDTSIRPNRIFIHILSEMEPLDTRVLQHAIYCNSNISNMRSHQIPVEEFSLGINASKEESLLSFYNLARLGCFRTFPKGESIDQALGIFRAGGMKIEVDQSSLEEHLKNNKPVEILFVGTDTDFLVSHLGKEMLQACSNS